MIQTGSFAKALTLRRGSNQNSTLRSTHRCGARLGTRSASHAPAVSTSRAARYAPRAVRTSTPAPSRSHDCAGSSKRSTAPYCSATRRCVSMLRSGASHPACGSRSPIQPSSMTKVGKRLRHRLRVEQLVRQAVPLRRFERAGHELAVGRAEVDAAGLREQALARLLLEVAPELPGAT